MKVENGFTGIPNSFIHSDAIKDISSIGFRCYVSLCHLLNFNAYRGDRLSYRDNKVVTTVTKLKAILGYSRTVLSNDGVKDLLTELEQMGHINDLSIDDNGKVKCFIDMHYEVKKKGTSYLYNNRLLKGKNRLRDGDLQVFLLLLSYGQHEWIKITYGFMAEILGVHEKTIKANINSLVKKGIIEVKAITITGGGSIKTQNSYRIIEQVDFDNIKATVQAERIANGTIEELADEVY